MKYLILVTLLVTAGCSTLHSPAKKDQVILNVPPELMKPPGHLEQL